MRDMLLNDCKNEKDEKDKKDTKKDDKKKDDDKMKIDDGPDEDGFILVKKGKKKGF